MHDYIRLGYIGLNDHEIRVMKSIFVLSPELKESYILTGSTDLEKSDLVLVNVDNSQSVGQWNEIARINRLATPITFSNKGKTIDGVVSLKLPIRVQKLIEALQNVISDRTRVKIPQGATANEATFNILVVDDSYPVRKYMEQKLADLARVPTSVSFADSGEHAMKKFNKHAFDMVFLDVVMEGVDGYRVCKAIKSKYKAYVVMLTSKKSPFDKVRGTMSGCDAYITKPPEDRRLIEQVEKCVSNRARNQNTFPATDQASAF